MGVGTGEQAGATVGTTEVWLWWLSDWITTTHIFMRKTAMVGGVGREKRGQPCTLVVVAKAPKSATQRLGFLGFFGACGALWRFWVFLEAPWCFWVHGCGGKCQGVRAYPSTGLLAQGTPEQVAGKTACDAERRKGCQPADSFRKRRPRMSHSVSLQGTLMATTAAIRITHKINPLLLIINETSPRGGWFGWPGDYFSTWL